MNIIYYGLICICFACLWGCVPEEPSNGWTLVNNFNEEILSVTVYETDGKIEQSPVHPTIVSPHSSVIVSTSMYMTIHSELKFHPETRIYFIFPESGFDISEIQNIARYSVALFNPESNWLLDRHETIRFPEDCTVNPDLWKIYDLDKFVELYGPLNAQGWDEVWQKWEQSKEERHVLSIY